ncbi:MAG TPA: gephyrin-like molybdotransferase Glp [Actinomycetota bacterium]|nr:gephyrin-like molybdotransferase Glp [Actinomycetota bacterium]
MTASMIPIDDARRRVLDSVQPLSPIELPLIEAHGCVLARDVAAEFDIPSFSSSEVDGIAVRAADIHGASSEASAALRITGRSVTGRPPGATVGWGEAMRIAPGAPLPAGADTVVPLEVCTVEGETVRVTEALPPASYVRPAGEDVRAGEVLVPSGRRLSGPEIGILAASGQPAALAHPKVRVGVLSMGSGLVEPGHPAEFGSIRDSGSYTVFGALRDLGAVPYRMGIVTGSDEDLREALLSNLVRADAFVALAPEAEASRLVHALGTVADLEWLQVAMYPGMTQVVGTIEGMPFFLLSASPVSAFVSFEMFVRPALLKMMGRQDIKRPEVMAAVDEDLLAPAGLTLVAAARVTRVEGKWHAKPAGPAGPNFLAALVRANGLILVPPEQGSVPVGTPVRVQVFRSLDR